MFNYSQAFRRNLGWITEAEQLRLRYATVAIGGMGGVGGHYLLALARLGVGKFRIADYDHFELANFNRQAGATLATVNLSKCDTMAAMAQAINPTAKIEIYGQGLSDNVLNDFFEGVDIYRRTRFFCLRHTRKNICCLCGIKNPCNHSRTARHGGCLVMFHARRNGFQNLFSVEKPS